MRFEDEDDDEDERLALPRLLRARTDHRQFKERRFARGQRRPDAPQAKGEEKDSGFSPASERCSDFSRC